MLHVNRTALLGLTACAFAIAIIFPSFAKGRKAINSISLSITAHIETDTDYGDEQIEIETNSNKFTVDDYEILNQGHGWTDDTVPKIRITLIAGDDYQFQSLSKDKITLKGGAKYLGSQRQDSNYLMLVDVELPAFQMSMGSLGKVQVNDHGIAAWDAVPGAGSYEVKIYRDDKAVGDTLTVRTNSHNFRDRMTRGDSFYVVKVRPVGMFDRTEKGEWVSSLSTYISSGQAAKFRENPGGGTGTWVQMPEDGRWRYINADGSYPADCWQSIGDKWYFFDGQGFMRTGWVTWDGKEYYCSENGDMQTDCITPDNYWVGADGAKIAQ